VPSPSPLRYGAYYHIYNRGANRASVFTEKRNYCFFMERYAKYIEPVAFTYVYCLLDNHFHFVVRTKTPEEQKESLKNPETFRLLEPSRQFSNLFNSYAKAFNKMYNRSGSLFEHPFRRIEIETDAHFVQLIAYIHRNPQEHSLADDFRNWPFSSYQAILTKQPTRVQRDEVLEWFGGLEGFLRHHEVEIDSRQIAPVVIEDSDL